MKINSVLRGFIAIGLVVIGILLILSNLDIISLEISDAVVKSWPFFIVLLGWSIFISDFKPGGDGSWEVGSFFLVYGILVWLGNFNVISFGLGDIWRLWPLLFIYIGVNLLFRNKKKRKKHKIVTGKSGKQVTINIDPDSIKEGVKSSIDMQKIKEAVKDSSKYKSFLGDYNFSDPNWVVEPMDLWTGVGDIDFDFTKAYIPDKETVISLRGWVGDVRMLVPDDLDFRIEAHTNVGDIHIFDKKADGLNRKMVYQTPGYDEASRKLTIYMHYQVGDIRVNKV
ncbi:MAG: cell wall-active antibiotics response protein [Bacillaceae bacterium]|nr:cell wall-active antibiotics response protein [Bacillaceae bacterium]